MGWVPGRIPPRSCSTHKTPSVSSAGCDVLPRSHRQRRINLARCVFSSVGTCVCVSLVLLLFASLSVSLSRRILFVCSRPLRVWLRVFRASCLGLFRVRTQGRCSCLRARRRSPRSWTGSRTTRPSRRRSCRCIPCHVTPCRVILCRFTLCRVVSKPSLKLIMPEGLVTTSFGSVQPLPCSGLLI